MSEQLRLQTRRVVGLVAVIAVIALVLGVTVAYSLSPSGKTSATTSSSNSSPIFTSSSISCKRNISYNGGNYSECLMTVEQLEQSIQNPNNSFTNDNGTIYLYIGHNACTIWFYYLPNDTNVIEYLGDIGTQTCE